MSLFWRTVELLLILITKNELILEIESEATGEENAKSFPGRDAPEEVEQLLEMKFPACPDIQSSIIPLDCADISRAGCAKSGVGKIWPKSRALEYAPFHVYCDMETDGGGWTVIQRRGNFSKPIDFFFKRWQEYKEGFGNIEEDFWLGNDKMFALTNQRLYSVRFDLEDVEGEKRYALYDTFWIDGEESLFMLHVKGYSGDAGDAFTYHDGQMFSTEDKDNDGDNNNCAKYYKGAWWYAGCHNSNLNGMYYYGKHASEGDGVSWSTFKGHRESLAATEIKIRPKNFVRTPLANNTRFCVSAKLWDFVA